MKKRLIILLALIGVFAQVAGAVHTGRVFIDKNKNGRFDSDEKPLAGVTVSDGLQVVQTETDGSFRLPGHVRERFIFITTPSGYTAVNHYYRPITPETASYDFGLRPSAGGIGKDGSHSFIHISDTEIFNTENHSDWVTTLRDYARNENIAFIMHTGDICYEKGLTEHIGLMNTENMGCPMFYTLGNHDLVDGAYGEELFEKIYGPVFYSFDVGNTHYIVTPMAKGDRQPSYTPEDVYRWLKNDLRYVPAGKTIVMFNHDLPIHTDKFLLNISDSERIDLNKHNLKAWIYGHWHTNYMQKQGSVYTICTNSLDKGGIDHSTAAFRVLHINPRGDISSQLRYTYMNKHLEIAAPGENGFPVFISGAIPLTVNTYHSSSPTREVQYTCWVDGKKLYTNKKLTQRTDWTWKDVIYLTPQPRGKEIRLKVTAFFRNGEKAEKEMRFPYANPKPQTSLTTSWGNLLGNPEHTGTAASVIQPPLKMAWTNNIGANIYMTSPVIHKGTVYIASVDENLENKAFIYALNGQTGDLKWKYAVHNSIKNSIAVEDDLVVAQNAQGTIYAVKTEDGSLKWGRELHVNSLPPLVEGLVVSEGVVYAGTGDGLCALQLRTGDRLWENTSWKQGEGATATLTLGKEILISSSQWKGLYGNDARTGELRWQLAKNGLSDRGASGAIHDNLLYITSSHSLFIIDPVKGNIIVRKEYPFSVDVTSTPLVTDEEIVFGSVANGLIAVDKETLEMKWQFQTGDALVYTAPYTRKVSATIETSPVVSGNTIYFGASDGCLYGVDKTTGQQVWKHATGAPAFGSVAISGNTLVAVDFGGNVYAFVTQ